MKLTFCKMWMQQKSQQHVIFYNKMYLYTYQANCAIYKIIINYDQLFSFIYILYILHFLLRSLFLIEYKYISTDHTFSPHLINVINAACGIIIHDWSNREDLNVVNIDSAPFHLSLLLFSACTSRNSIRLDPHPDMNKKINTRLKIIFHFVFSFLLF